MTVLQIRRVFVHVCACVYICVSRSREPSMHASLLCSRGKKKVQLLSIFSE